MYGLDKIPASILRDSNEIIAPYLTYIFNCSIYMAIFPDDWKMARVSPIFKSGSKNDCGNYRPISILPSVAKIFEKLVCDQLKSYLSEQNILSKYQSGFRWGHSTSSSLLKTTNSWLLNIDSGMINGVLFLDLKKAFDTIDHDILLRKLFLYGIRGVTLDWFSSYLSDRAQVCKINNTTSSLKYIKCGVPQGSNLGPLLFLLYINDLPQCLNTSIPAMFADDTHISVSGENREEIENCLNMELENIHRWLQINKLTLNVDKTEYMMIGSRQKLASTATENSVKLEINGKVIKRVAITKSLGVLVDENLSWNEQIDSVNAKVSRAIGMIRRAKPYVTSDTLKLMYQSLVLPYFDYCSLVWRNCNETLKNKVQRLQNRAARVITGDTYDVRSVDVLNKLGWKNLEERRDVQTESYVTNALRGKCPENINEMFKPLNRDHYQLRDNNLVLMLSKPRTNAMKRSFSYAAAKIWNNQNINIRREILTQL